MFLLVLGFRAYIRACIAICEQDVDGGRLYLGTDPTAAITNLITYVSGTAVCDRNITTLACAGVGSNQNHRPRCHIHAREASLSPVMLRRYKQLRAAARNRHHTTPCTDPTPVITNQITCPVLLGEIETSQRLHAHGSVATRTTDQDEGSLSPVMLRRFKQPSLRPLLRSFIAFS